MFGLTFININIYSAGLLPCDPCDAVAAGKDGKSMIIENGNVDGFPVMKLADDEARADNGWHLYTWGAITCEDSNLWVRAIALRGMYESQ